MLETSDHFWRHMHRLSLILGHLIMPLCVAVVPGAGPTTQPSDKDKVDVGLFVQSTTWDTKRVSNFPVILHCACSLGSRYEGRKLNVIDGTEGRGESDSLLPPPTAGHDPYYELNAPNPPNPGHPGDYWMWCYEFQDATGRRLKRLGQPKESLGTGEILFPYPENTPQKILSSENAFFLTSMDSSDTSTVEASKIILRAFVVLDFKVVGRSNEVTIKVK